MELTVHGDTRDFLAEAGPLLTATEAENNLMLGVARRLADDPSWSCDYLATVQSSGRTIAAALLTPPYKLLVTHAPLPALDRLAADLRQRKLEIPGVLGPQETAHELGRRLAAALGLTLRSGLAMLVYRLTEVRSPRPTSGELRLLGESDRDLLFEWTTAFFEELPISPPQSVAEYTAEIRSLGRAYAWEDDRPVSMAAQVGDTPHGARVALVYTPPELRGRGYGGACVAGTCQALLAGGKDFCFLFADLDNPVTNRLYRRVGFEPVCTFQEFAFDAAPTDAAV